MPLDFTPNTYERLLHSAKNAGYTLTSYEDYIFNGYKYNKVFILRHDVDDLPRNSVLTAKIEHKLGVKGTYYFRVVQKSFKPDCINEIIKLGHEIGYHYEDMALTNGDYNKAIKHFKEKLSVFRSFYPVKTICMHGSPMSKWDNKLLWQKFNYRQLGIEGEPYFDLDFTKVLYVTDTGRKWNNTSSSVRDKVKTNQRYSFGNTFAIISAFEQNKLPQVIMLNIHPQRWHNNKVLWLKELILQSIKNQVKKLLVKRR